MKTQHALKPIVIALAVVLSAAAYAGNKPPRGEHQPPGGPSTPALEIGASATVDDTQSSSGNDVQNHSTKNNATLGESDVTVEANGNTGINVVAGDGNQQANAAAIATADALTVFGQQVGSANAGITVDQSGSNNVDNYGTQNNATLSSAIDSSGNLGINVGAGNFNQQKNDLAIANSSKAQLAGASVDVTQDLSDNTVNNQTGAVFEETAVTLASTNTYNHYPQQPSGPQATPKTPVVNNAVLSGAISVSGNAGINVAAGVANQQSNSLAIAAGCTACAAGN